MIMITQGTFFHDHNITIFTHDLFDKVWESVTDPQFRTCAYSIIASQVFNEHYYTLIQPVSRSFHVHLWDVVEGYWSSTKHSDLEQRIRELLKQKGFML